MKFFILILTLSASPLFGQMTDNDVKQKAINILKQMERYKGKLDRVTLEKFYSERPSLIKFKRQNQSIPTNEAQYYYDQYSKLDSLLKEKSKVRMVQPYDIFNCFNADEIISYNLLGDVTGCTGDARVFLKLAREQGLQVKYVITISRNDYEGKCPDGDLPL